MLSAKRLRRRWVLIDDGCKGVEGGEISDDVPAPIAGSNHGDHWTAGWGGARCDRRTLRYGHPARPFRFDVPIGWDSRLRQLLAHHPKPFACVSRVDDETRSIDQHLVVDVVMIGRDQGGIVLSKCGRIKDDRGAASKFGMLARLGYFGNVGIKIIDPRLSGLEQLHELERWALPHVIDILLIGETHDEN